jgi:hypothetical protein
MNGSATIVSNIVYWIPATLTDDDVRAREDAMTRGEAAITRRRPGEDEGKRARLLLLSTLPGGVDPLPQDMVFRLL